MKKLLALLLLLIAVPVFGQAPPVPQGFVYVTDANGAVIAKSAALQAASATARGTALNSIATTYGTSGRVVHIKGTSYTLSTIPPTTPTYVGEGPGTVLTISGSTLLQLAAFASRCASLVIVASDGTAYLDASGTKNPVAHLNQRILKCDKSERTNCNAGWTTMANVSDGPAVVTRLWIAASLTNSSHILSDKIRVTFDGAGSPQIIAPIGDFCGVGDQANIHWRHSVAGGMLNGTDISGFITLPMPYATSCKVELNGPDSAYCMLERVIVNSTSDFLKLGLPSASLRLTTYGDGLSTSVAEFAEQTLLDTHVPTVFVGLHHFVTNSNDNGYIEGNYKGYYGGSGTADYESSGTEDFYHSAFGFTEGPVAVDNEAVLEFNGSNPFYMLANRFFQLNIAPYHASGIKWTWHNGESAVSNSGASTTRWLIYTYQ